MKNYYTILAIAKDATDNEIRKAYRRLALAHHPDKNPGDPRAEERFKEISEAYGVLIDPVKRQEYDRSWMAGTRHGTAGGFHYTQEEILQDLFRDPRFNQIFQGLFREFEKSGVRFDQQFFDKTFFGGRGIFFGGVFVWGPFGMGNKRFPGTLYRNSLEKTEQPLFRPAEVLKRIGRTVAGLFGGPPKLAYKQELNTGNPLDLSYRLAINPQDGRQGTWVQIAMDRGKGRETLKVKIPPGTRAGTRLRLKGKGRIRGAVHGDLYITVQHEPE